MSWTHPEAAWHRPCISGALAIQLQSSSPHDLGTSGNKASLFSADGKLKGSQVYSYDVHYFNATWAEQDADDWWKAVCITSKNLIAKCGIDPREIGAVSFSGQMMGCLCVNKEGISAYDLINAEIEESPAGANGVLFLSYLLGERAPRWNPYAKGSFLGLKAENTRNDLLRSVLEGVTMNLAVILDVLKTKVEINEIMAIGGGAKGAVWRQIMADVFNTRITVPLVLEEADSMGAAVIGGVGTEMFQSFDAIEKFVEIESVCEPNPEAVEVYKPVRALFEDCYAALEKLYPRM